MTLRHRPHRRGPQGARRRVQADRRRRTCIRRRVPGARRPDGRVVFPQDVAAQLQALDRGGLPQLDEPPRGRLPPHGEDRRRPRHRGQRPGDGLRQQGRRLGDRRRVHAQPRRRHQRDLRRLPDQRAGRGRRRRHPQHRSRSPTSRPRRASSRPAPSSGRSSTILENHYRDMCDIEFTIEQGKLWMLQTRIGKRTARAALKIAVDMVGEGMITKEEAVLRVDPQQLDQLLHPQFDAKATYDVLAKGLNASPGAAVGEVVFSADDAVAAADAGPLGHPGPLGDHARRPARHDRRQGHPHVARRQDQPRGGRRPRHGQAVRLRRRQAQDRRRATRSPPSPTATSSCTRATSSPSTAPPASSSSAR